MELPDDLVRFSFRHYQDTQKYCMPDFGQKAGYPLALFERMRDVSHMKLSEFRIFQKPLRNHKHVWEKTSEPDGYAHLTEQLRQCEPWQFCLTSNEHGRVHGILVDNIFYVVWLDHGHALYP